MGSKQIMRIVLTASATLALTVGVATATAGGGGGTSQKKLCFQGGWQTVYGTDGTTFTSQKECVSYVTKGGTLTTTRPPQGARIDCELFGGIFTPNPPWNDPAVRVLWTCNGLSFTDSAQFFAETDTLKADCSADDEAAGLGGEGNNADFDTTCFVWIIPPW